MDSTTPERRRRAAARHRWGGTVVTLAAVAAVLGLAACGGGLRAVTTPSGKVDGKTVEGLYGALPSSGAPTGGGTITMGQQSGDTPTYLFPIVPSSYATDGTAFLVDQLFVPLYNLQVGGSLQVNYDTSVADRPVFSDHDKRVTIQLRSNARWSNGRRVNAQDVLFYIALLKAAIKLNGSNWDQYTPGLLPDNLAAARATGPDTVQLTFKRSYNPAFLTGDQLAGTITPLPSDEWNIDSTGGRHLSDWQNPAVAAKIYTYLNKQASVLSTYSTNPLWRTVDGPFRLSSFNTTTSSFALAANPSYDLAGKVRFSKLSVNTYTSSTAELDALRTGALDVGTLDFSQLGDAAGLKDDGYSVYGYPNIGSFGLILNFKDTTGHFNKIISQLYIRQALSHLVDQPAYITGIFKGVAAPAYGPLPTLPKTPYTPADAGTDPYPYSIKAAAGLLRAHGWKVVPGGQTRCVKPGSGPGQCGAGIPAGTPFAFQMWSTPESSTASIALESDSFASAAKQVGIAVTLGYQSFDYQTEYFNDQNPGARKDTNKWAIANWGEYGTSPYPTEENIFNTGGGSDLGGYSSPTTDKLIQNAIYGTQADAATKVADYLARQVPIIALPCADVLDAVSNKIGGTSDAFLAMTQDVFYPQFFYLKKA